MLKDWSSEAKGFTMLYLVFGSPVVLLLDVWLGRLLGRLTSGVAETTGSRAKALLLSLVCLAAGYAALCAVGFLLTISSTSLSLPAYVDLALLSPLFIVGTPLFSVPLVLVPLLAAVAVASFAANDAPFKASVVALLVGAFVWLGFFLVLYRSVRPG